MPPGWAYDAGRYEKRDVERIYLDRGATICRLPMVYGAGDYARREEFILRRVRAGRDRIPVGPGSFLCSRGYAPEIARGIRLALESGVGGEIAQPWLADPTKARERLGWVHEPWRGCVERSVQWHLEHPPPAADVDSDFSADDAALASVDRG